MPDDSVTARTAGGGQVRFTAGRWQVAKRFPENPYGPYAAPYWGVFAGATLVCTTRFCNGERAAANARLIAAAPALYAALEAMVEPWNGFSLAETERRCDSATFRNVIAARAALALALAHPAAAQAPGAGGGA